ncbi:MAG: PD40 domain-containing protein [Gemmatimonadota bacterium]|nr:MAG: PD40 domain-containing protein [Gemmatimonadota bacterium]
MRITNSAAIWCASLMVWGCTPSSDGSEFPELTGAYLGQTPPGNTPELFAPGIVSTGMYTRDIAMTPDGSELYFCVMESGFSVILRTKLVNDRWTEPEIVPFSADGAHQEIEPHITSDGSKMLFLSDRRPDGEVLAPEERGQWANQNIWVVDRVGDEWGEPYLLAEPVTSDSSEFFPSVTQDGTIYFTRSVPGESYIYRSRFVDGSYQEPERLPPQVNSTTQQYNAFIAPDESYIIVPVSGREDSHGGTDYYIVFRSEDDQWSEPINLGDRVNTADGREFSPYVSPDGKYFFFMAVRRTPWDQVPDTLTMDYVRDRYMSSENGQSDIYWVDAGFIEELRRQAWDRGS